MKNLTKYTPEEQKKLATTWVASFSPYSQKLKIQLLCKALLEYNFPLHKTIASFLYILHCLLQSKLTLASTATARKTSKTKLNLAGLTVPQAPTLSFYFH